MNEIALVVATYDVRRARELFDFHLKMFEGNLICKSWRTVHGRLTIRVGSELVHIHYMSYAELDRWGKGRTYQYLDDFLMMHDVFYHSGERCDIRKVYRSC